MDNRDHNQSNLNQDQADEVCSLQTVDKEIENILASDFPLINPDVIHKYHDKIDTLPQEIIAQLHERLSPLLTELAEQIKQAQIEKHVIEKLSRRNTELEEQFYQNQVLLPIFLTLIGIIDRCRQKIQALKHSQRLLTPKSVPEKQISYLIEARKADQIELENILASHGVELYQNPDCIFDPTTQRCLSRIETSESGKINMLAARILPGYRRDGKILRKECVHVYVSISPKPIS